MNQTRIALAAALFLSMGTLTFGQDPGPETKPPEPRPPAQQGPQQEGETPPKHQQEEAKPSKPEKPEKQENQKLPKESKPEKTPQATQERGQQAPAQHETQGHARPAGKSAHIPDQKFKASFGSQHRFAARQVIQTTTVVAGQTQFVYSGYTFVILDPWPGEWLYTDDCYIEYVDDDYFLFDALHPGIRIALFVQM